MINRNKIIGILLGSIIGYGSQAIVYYVIGSGIAKVARISFDPFKGYSIIILKSSTKHVIKGIRYIAKTSIRTNFNPEVIFEDAIDASFFAY